LLQLASDRALFGWFVFDGCHDASRFCRESASTK
jgi:hypothetical protein